MLLPIYVSLEKIDVRLVDAASDLYSSFRRTFRTVILPLSLPGIFAGTLLTFIPATGDFINASLLGNPNTSVIGNVVQTQFLNRNDYPTAAAISFVLMAIITLLVLDLRQVPRHGGHGVSESAVAAIPETDVFEGDPVATRRSGGCGGSGGGRGARTCCGS